jgi:hypothetical protein
LEAQGRLDFNLQVRLLLADVAKRVLDAGWSHDARTRAALGPLAAHVEADMACEHFEALLLAGVVVRGHITARVGEHLRVQPVTFAAEREPLAANRIVNELDHNILLLSRLVI